MKCNQCSASVINGVFCHEAGCPNKHKTWVPDREEWVLFVPCGECGEDVEEGEICACALEEQYKETFEVSVEKRLYATGTYKVEAFSPEEAEEKVNELISAGELQTTDIEWGDEEYEDGTFQTTGDVD